jgi:hypothetical protein
LLKGTFSVRLFTNLRSNLFLLALATLAFATSPAAAQLPMPMTDSTPNAELLSRFTAAGGGAGSFRTATFIDSVSVGHPNEKKRLQTRFGADRMATFTTVFDHAVAASLKGKAISANAEPGGDLGVALYRAGQNKAGKFNVEQLFDVLFGASTHMKTMLDVAQRYGALSEATYHQVLTALIEDVGKPAEMPGSGASPMSMSSKMPMPSGMAMPMASGMPMKMSSPMPMSSAMPMHGMRDMRIGGKMSMPTNANGVMSMFGSAKMAMNVTTMSMRMMPAVTDLGVPMSREGSGTAWLPDSSTTFGHMSMSGDNMLMTHGAGFVRYSDTFSDRGTRTLNAPDWYMAMGTHPLSPASQLGARIMVTSDFATVGGFGYPELFQTGESYHGKPLHDHQHPHDLFSEAALTYSTQMSRDASAFVYVGYPGEPALGPPTYMHRLIAYDMPDAPIGHHWEDSTHITFGVVTAGLTLKNVRFEASTFTGREPNEIRTNFDPISLDSVSGRISWNPTANLATQVSYGYIKSPEALTPDLNQHRTTASIVYNKPLALGEFFTASTVWGQNYESDGARSNAYLLEADYHRLSDSIYSRAEFVQKSGNELVLDADPTQLATSPSLTETLFPIGAYTVGYVHDLKLTPGTVMGLGGQVTFNTRPGSLVTFYGPQTPWGFELFARFRPTAMR